jgi:hypothetical protein
LLGALTDSCESDSDNAQASPLSYGRTSAD